MSDAPARGTHLRSLIDDGRVHVLDGAMGTLLYGRGVFVNVCYDALALDRPELVRSLHREYVAAGAEVIETNTFGANPVKLSSYGLEAKTAEINRAAARLAREAADGVETEPDADGPDGDHPDGDGARGRGGSRGGNGRNRGGGGPAVSVLGAVGPLGIRIEPWGPTSVEEAAAHYRAQVQGLLEGGVDGFCLETFSDLSELEAAFRAVRALSDLPVFAQITVGEDLRTSLGTDAAHAARELDELGADVIGLNCSVGPAIILEAAEEMLAHTDHPVVAQPNAGLPRTVRDRKMYMASPEYMAQYGRRLMEAGVRFLGGCCGTTPEHVKAVTELVRSVQPRHPRVRVVEGVEEVEEKEPVPLAERSALGRALAEERFATTVELLPPPGWDGDALLERARALGAAGVDALSIVDSPRGRIRMGSIAAGLLLVRARLVEDAPLPEPLVHYTCRDRNMVGMIGDLLGAAAGGIRNVLLVSGDPPVQGPYPDSTAVFDIDSIGLTNVVRGLNRGLDPGGHEVGPPTPFVIGVAANHGAVDPDREAERFMWKVEAGAEYAVTQPVFDPEVLAGFLERTAAWPIPVLAGLWPLTDLRNAEYLANEVPGVVVPDEVLERMRDAQTRGDDAARAEGAAIAREVLEAVRGMERVRGVAVSAPGGDVATALDVLAPVLGAGPRGSGGPDPAAESASPDP